MKALGLVFLFVSIHANALIAEGGISGSGPIPRPFEHTYAVTFADHSGAREACLNGTSPEALRAMQEAKALVAKDCESYANVNVSARGDWWVVQERQDGMPSADCEAHATLECWN